MEAALIEQFAPRDKKESARKDASVNVSSQVALAHSVSLRATMHGLLLADRAGVSKREVELLPARLIDAMLEGVAICDRAHLIVYVNHRLCHMLGRSAGELVGKPAWSLFGEDYPRSVMAAGDAEGGCSSSPYEAELFSKDGARIVVEIATQRIERECGLCLGSFALLTDITLRANTQRALQRSESDLRLLSAQLWKTQELERQRIARELHDGIGQSLGGIKFSLESCCALIEAGNANAALVGVQQQTRKIRDLVEEVRRIAMDLRPSTLDDLGILATIGWFSREFRSIYGQVRLETTVDAMEDEIVPPLKTAIYRIIQEATNNVVTHSGARNIWLTMKSVGQHIELRIADDGSGFNPGKFSVPDENARGLGLASMRERAEATGGRLRIESQDGRGTAVVATWPSQKK